MSTNDIFLLCICAVAAFDVIFATLYFPKLLAKNPETTPETAKLLQMILYAGAGFITIVGFVIHHLNIIK